MKTDDFDYDLPDTLIAQSPAEPRDSCRLLVLDRATGEVTHRIFTDICDYLEPGDLLVANKTRVLPARLVGRKPTGAVCETLLLTRREDIDPLGHVWECLVNPGRRLKPGATIEYRAGGLHAPTDAPVILRGTVESFVDDSKGGRLVRFEPLGGRTLDGAMHEAGHVPLPPYITHKLQDKSRYQTVYARYDGSAAAPTAGLHFTPGLLSQIRDKGVKLAYVTLHVGLGTFRPVKAENVLEHHMHSEYYRISKEAAALINETKEKGGRVICVGTTSCRTVESAADEDGRLEECCGNTEIFIYPGYRFKATDCLITNFHLPESTLVMLVSALAGRERVLNAYREAVRERYRFFSFGDACFFTDSFTKNII